MLGTPEQDAFISDMKWASVTTLRKDGSPTSSIVYYYRDGDTLVFSTTSNRLKGRTIANDPRVAFTVLDEGAPHRYVTVEGTATIQSEDILPGHIKLNAVMRGGEFTPPEGYAERLQKEGRILVHVHAQRVSGVVRR